MSPLSWFLAAAPAWAADAATSVGTAAADGWQSHFPPATVAIFAGVFALSMIVDLVQHRSGKDVSVASAAAWSIFWIFVSLGFCGWLAWYHGADHPEWPSLFLTGYILELTLSIDNLVVFIAIFRFFRIRSGLQHRILYYGILGAIFFRAAFVVLGAGLLKVAGPWAELLFGIFVGWAALQMLIGRDNDHDGEPDYEKMPLVRAATRFYPVFPKLVGDRFFVTRAEAEAAIAQDPEAGHIKLASGVTRWMTPAFVCLLVIEGSDVLFAVDSVPAVIAVTKEPLIVYTAMIFAVLGLRSMFFIVEALTGYLVHLEKAVIGVLFFVALKMLVGAAEHLAGLHLPFELTPSISMYIVLGMLATGVVASLLAGKKVETAE